MTAGCASMAMPTFCHSSHAQVAHIQPSNASLCLEHVPCLWASCAPTESAHACSAARLIVSWCLAYVHALQMHSFQAAAAAAKSATAGSTAKPFSGLAPSPCFFSEAWPHAEYAGSCFFVSSQASRACKGPCSADCVVSIVRLLPMSAVVRLAWLSVCRPLAPLRSQVGSADPCPIFVRAARSSGAPAPRPIHWWTSHQGCCTTMRSVCLPGLGTRALLFSCGYSEVPASGAMAI